MQLNAEALFQFHEGPIKTYCFIRAKAAVFKFQFHEGPIKTGLKTSSPTAQNRFNSMKVRLKPWSEKMAALQNQVSIP